LEDQIKMSEISCQGSPGYVDKEVGLPEEEQAVAQPPPTFEMKWTVGRKDEQLRDVIEMTILLKALVIPL
jgi:hypothetical protein